MTAIWHGHGGGKKGGGQGECDRDGGVDMYVRNSPAGKKTLTPIT